MSKNSALEQQSDKLRKSQARHEALLRLVDRLHAGSADSHDHHAASFEALQREFGSVAAAIADAVYVPLRSTDAHRRLGWSSAPWVLVSASGEGAGARQRLGR